MSAPAELPPLARNDAIERTLSSSAGAGDVIVVEITDPHGDAAGAVDPAADRLEPDFGSQVPDRLAWIASGKR
jgi:hypothetical protein